MGSASHDHSYRQFRDYYGKYVKKIYSYLYFRTGRNQDLAEDLTSEVFLKALENFSSFDPTNASFGAWVYAIARNHLIDHYRVSRTSVPLDDISETHAAPQGDLGAQLDNKAHLRVVITAINKLPPNYRDILTLKYLNGFNNTELEQVLGKSQTNIRVLVHRSLAALKDTLKQLPDA